MDGTPFGGTRQVVTLPTGGEVRRCSHEGLLFTRRSLFAVNGRPYGGRVISGIRQTPFRLAWTPCHHTGPFRPGYMRQTPSGRAERRLICVDPSYIS